MSDETDETDEMSTREVSTQVLVDELNRRGVLPGCPCGKWGVYYGSYDSDGYTLRCFGCVRATARCTCRGGRR